MKPRSPTSSQKKNTQRCILLFASVNRHSFFGCFAIFLCCSLNSFFPFICCHPFHLFFRSFWSWMRSHVVHTCICARIFSFVLVKDISKTHTILSTHYHYFVYFASFSHRQSTKRAKEKNREIAREREKNACLVRIQFYDFAERYTLRIWYILCAGFLFSVWLYHGFACYTT